MVVRLHCNPGVTVSPLLVLKSPLLVLKSPLSSRGGQNQPNLLYFIQRELTRIASRMQLCHLPPLPPNIQDFQLSYTRVPSRTPKKIARTFGARISNYSFK